ncbi:hypothetical protein QTP70_030520 [Hemibagrus guttatus]|uniref:Reverse transcriptase n=1 Tax=Hemibagrus guttatus TaxID=175788 RepID=A0AAE0RLM5_9TELE|nr:hypothetical protein QTP70_030520 [Hemibagrus guttatus]
MQLCFEEHQDQPAVSTTIRQPEPVSHPEPVSNAMHLGHSGVSSTERQRERQRQLTQSRCFYCGSSIFRGGMPPLPGMTNAAALLDSGSAGNFISGTLCRQLHLRTTTTPKVYQIHAVTGRFLQQVRRLAGPLRLQIRFLHMEEIYLMVLENSTADVVLGHPWLEQHDPILSWKTGEVLRWGVHCFKGCFPERPSPRLSRIHEVQVHATSVESPLENRSITIPACYSRFSDLFCPKKTSKLPPHRPWDCAIDLIPGEPVPRGRIYSLSLPEEKAMEEYITEALAQGYIRPSTSPAASSFFFVAKKDGGLRPCIDYRALNKITVKFRYPLPLVPLALEHLHSATVFTKLDLRSAYNLIRIREGDEWKTAFMSFFGNPKKLHPCAFFLRKLNPAEVNYDIGNRELLAIKLALEEWRHWLEGAKHPFTVLTDHKNLEYLRAAKSLNPRQARWALFFTRFHFSISYRPGLKNVKADALSRIHSLEATNEDPEPILPEKLFASPISWSEETLPEPNAPASAPPGCPPGLQFVPPPSFIPCTRLWALATLESTEPSCSLNNVSGGPTWQRISKVSLGYHPQTNGQTERKIQEVGRFLRTFCHRHQESWSQFLGWAEYAQNSLRQSTTGLTPFQCVLGYQRPLFPWDGEPSDVPAVDYWFRESERVWGLTHLQLQRALRRRRTTADLRRSQASEYQPRQKVWLSTQDIKLCLPCRKLSPWFIGPFTTVTIAKSTPSPTACNFPLSIKYTQFFMFLY